MRNKTKSIFQNIVLLVASITISVLLAEISLRLILPAPIVWKYPQEIYQGDSEIGHWLVPKQNAFTHDKAVTTNSQGLRDSEYAAYAPDGVHRVLALGDSQTFGNGLALQDTWPKQLEYKLNSDTGVTRYEVLNAGLPGSDTWQHEIILERMLQQYHPHTVVLAFYVNDIVTRPDSIHFSRQGKRDEAKAQLIYFVKKSALLLTLRTAFDAISNAWFPSAGFLQQYALLQGERNSVIDRRWDQVDRSLAGMRRAAVEHGSVFLVVSLPRRDQVDGRLSPDIYNQRLQEILKRSNVSPINMLDSLQDAFKKYGKSLFIHWDGHNSEIANSVIASEISAVMQDLQSGRQ